MDVVVHELLRKNIPAKINQRSTENHPLILLLSVKSA